MSNSFDISEEAKLFKYKIDIARNSMSDSDDNEYYFLDEPLLISVNLLDFEKEDNVYLVTYTFSQDRNEEYRLRVKTLKSGDLIFYNEDLEKVIIYEIGAPESKKIELRENFKNYFKIVLPKLINQIESQIHNCGWIA